MYDPSTVLPFAELFQRTTNMRQMFRPARYFRVWQVNLDRQMFEYGGDHVSSFHQCPTKLRLMAKKEFYPNTKVLITPKTLPPPPLISFPPLPKYKKPIPGFTQSSPLTTPSSEPFPNSGFAESLSQFFQNFISINWVIKKWLPVYKHWWT